MAKSRVGEAIKAAIAGAKAITDRRSKFTRELSRLGGPRSGQKAVLKLVESLGVDVEQLARESAKQQKRVSLRRTRKGKRRQFKKPRLQELPPALYTTVPPPGDGMPTFPLCLYPAEDCSYSSPYSSSIHSDSWSWQVCNVLQAQMKMAVVSNNVGGLLGILATPWVPPVTGSLWYGLIPPIGGTLAVIAEVRVSGRILVWAESGNAILNLLPSLKADALARLVVRTYQDGGTGVQGTSQIIGEAHCGGGEKDGYLWVDDLFVLVLYSQVLPAIPVAIEVGVELECSGRSTFGTSEIQLEGIGENNYRPGLEVAALCLNLTPTIIL